MALLKIMKTITRFATLFLFIFTIATATAEELFASPLKLFQDALVPALTHSESGSSVTRTWRGFQLRADSQSGLKNQHVPSDAGIRLDASVRDAVEVPKFTDTTTTEKGITTRTVRFPAVGENQDQGLVVTLVHGPGANREALDAINRSIANIRRRAEQAGTGQPATRSESKSDRNQNPNPETEGRSR